MPSSSAAPATASESQAARLRAWKEASFVPQPSTDPDTEEFSQQRIIHDCKASTGGCHCVLYEYGVFTRRANEVTGAPEESRFGWQISIGRDDDVQKQSDDPEREWNLAARIIDPAGSVMTAANVDVDEDTLILERTFAFPLCQRICKPRGETLETRAEKGHMRVWPRTEDRPGYRNTESALFAD
jgi:hypothetical protein